MTDNGDIPSPRGRTAEEIAREAFRVAWRADQHGVELHASVISHLAGTDGKVERLDEKVDDLTKEVRNALRELDRVRDRTPSVHDVEEAAHQGAAEAFKEAAKELSSPAIPRPQTDSERVRTVIAVDAHARRQRLQEAVVSAVVGGGVLTAIIEIAKVLLARGH